MSHTESGSLTLTLNEEGILECLIPRHYYLGPDTADALIQKARSYEPLRGLLLDRREPHTIAPEAYQALARADYVCAIAIYVSSGPNYAVSKVFANTIKGCPVKLFYDREEALEWLWKTCKGKCC